MPWLGINTFDKMIDLVNEIKKGLKLNSNYSRSKETNYEDGTITIGGQVGTGDSHNIVPPCCRFTIDRRLGVRENTNNSLNEFFLILDLMKKKDLNFVSDIKVISKYEPCVTPINSKLVSIIKESIISLTCKTPKISLMNGGCDMRYFHKVGIPTVIYGPGDINLSHQEDEYVEINSLITAAQVYTLSAIRLFESH